MILGQHLMVPPPLGGAVAAPDIYSAQFTKSTTDYAKITDAALGDLSSYTKISIPFTYRRDSLGLMYIGGQHSGTISTSSWLIGFSPSNKMRFIYYIGGGQYVVDSTTAFTGTAGTHSAMVTLDLVAQEVKLLHDGTDLAHGGATPIAGSLNNSSADINIGAYNSGTSPFDGRVGGFAIVSDILVWSDAFDGSDALLDLSGEGTTHEQWLFENDWTGEVSADLTPVNSPSFITN